MEPSTNKQTKLKKILPIIYTTAIFMQLLDSTILNTALASIAKDLNESTLHMQNAVVSYVLTLALLIPVSGFLADKYGTKTIFILSLSLFSIGSLCCAMAQNLSQLVIFRVIQGMGGALMIPVGRLVLIKVYPKNELLRAMNIAVIPALIGPILGPLVGGYMVVYFTWHWIFLINIPIGVCGILLASIYLPNYKEKAPHFDLKGFLIFAIASLCLAIGLELLGIGPLNTKIIFIMSLGLFMLFIYYRYASKTSEPIFPLKLFWIRTFRLGFWGNLITRLGISAIPLLVPLLIQLAYKKDAVVSGWIVAPMAFTAILGKSSVIKILNKLGYRTTLRINTFMNGIMIMCLAIPQEDSSIYWFLPITAILGYFNSIQYTSMNTISIADLRDHQNSSGNTLLSVNQQLSIGFGIAFGLLVLQFFDHQNMGHAHNLHSAFRYTFISLGLLTLFSGVLFKKLHQRDGDNLKSIHHNEEA